MELARCGDSGLHTGEDLTDAELAAAAAICEECEVRPECIEWALAEKPCAVIVAGRYLPDPVFKPELRRAFSFLKQSLPAEKLARGEEV
jgi:hypothetical protein